MSNNPRALFGDPIYPGHRLPERRADEEELLSSWGRLIKGQPLGKKTNLLYTRPGISPGTEQDAPCPLFELRGMDNDACQLQVTLCSPSAIPRTVADLGIDLQNQSGEFNNAQIGNGNYPGQVAPIVWPPFIAKLKWGVGGARAEAEVDFVNGTVINVPASALDVFAAIAPDADNAQGTTGLYTLSGFVSPGWPRPGNAQRTIYVGSLTNAEESDIFVVPAFSKRVTIIGCDDHTGVPAVTVAYLRFWRSPDGTSNAGNYLVSGNQPISFVVPNGAMYFSIVSGLSVTALLAACFDLAI